MIECIVIVEDPENLYRESRIDHAVRFSMIQRKKVTVVGRPYLSMTRPPMAAFSMFSDGFTSVYSDLEVIQMSEALANIRPLQAVFLLPNRIEDAPQEEVFHRVDQQLLFRFITSVGIEMMGFTIDIPELNDDPWLEWVHRPPVTDLFPYRQYAPVVARPSSVQMMTALRPPAPTVESEVDFRVPNLPLNFQPYRQIKVFTPPNIVRVRAVQVGFYFFTRNIGDVFDVDLAHFASSTVDFILGQEGSPFFGWMTVANPNERLSINSPTPLTTANKPRTVL